tara:strand:- start:187478 stop:188893 length:1416 start_codon:yes stop_codon:yes gene_type:complete
MRKILLGFALWTVSVSVAAAADRPNVILVYMDDMGWSDIGTQGATGFQTPHLDRLAAEGLRCTEFYSVCSVCSASRAGLMTGCYPARVMNQSVLFPDSTTALHPDENTMAEMFAGAGYQTHMVGKWHLGHQDPVLPTEQGFQSYYGVPYSNDMGCDPEMALADDVILRDDITRENFRSKSAKRYPLAPLMRDKEIIEVPSDQTTLTRRYTQRATELIKQHGSQDASEPLFLYFAHTMPHKPIAASGDFVGTTQRGLYGDVIEEIDWSIGQLVGAIGEAGIAENTLLIFSSDNGPWNADSATYLRGLKFSNFEGGQRVPTIVWWPGRIKGGSTTDQMGATIDILPTLASISGIEFEARDGAPLDGVDLSAHWLGNRSESPRQEFYYYGPTCGPKPQGIRDQRWKLLLSARKKKNDRTVTEPFPWLFDLESDERESTNVASSHPKVVQRLTAKIELFEKQMIDTQRAPWNTQP